MNIKTFCLTVGLLVCVPLSANASLYGTMSNFDTFNTTPEDAYGAEIELEGIHPEDIVNTYPAHYNYESRSSYQLGAGFGNCAFAILDTTLTVWDICRRMRIANRRMATPVLAQPVVNTSAFRLLAPNLPRLASIGSTRQVTASVSCQSRLPRQLGTISRRMAVVQLGWRQSSRHQNRRSSTPRIPIPSG